MNEIKRTHNWEKPKRKALTEAQQSAFISYVSSSPTYRHWLSVFTVLLGTGCRIGEVVGLRWQDCDFRRELYPLTTILCTANGKAPEKLDFM